MIQLKTEQGSLQLDKDASVQVTFCNPALDTDSADRSFSYPVTVPMTPKNNVYLDYPNRVDSPMTSDIPLSLSLSSHLLERGIGVIDEVNDHTASLVFQSNTRHLLTEMEKLQVALLLETIEIQQVVQAFWLFDCDVPFVNRSYYISINDVSFLVSATATDTKATLLSRICQAINARFPAMASVKDAWMTHPQLKLEATNNGVKVGFLEGLRIVAHRLESQARHANLQTFLREKMPHPAFALPQYTHIGFYGEKNGWFSGQVNYLAGNEPQETPVFQYNLVPMVRLSYVLAKMETALKVRFRFDFPNADALIGQLLIYSNYAMDSVIEEWTVAAPPKKQYVNVHQKRFKLSDLVPKWTAKQWITNLCAQFGLSYELKGNTVFFTKKNRVFRQTAVNMSQYVVEMISKKRSESKGYGLDFIRNEFTPPNLVGWNVSEDFKPTELPFATFPTNAVTGLGGSAYESIGTKPYPVALIFDHFSHQNAYFSLLITGEKGLLETFFRGILETQGGTTYQLLMRLPFAELIALRQFGQNWYIRLPTGSFDCVVKEASFKATQQKTDNILTKVDCVTYC